MKKLFCGVALLFLIIVLPGLAWAHSDEYLDTVEAPHGGQLRMAGPFHLELVAKGGELQLYVTDHMDKEIATKGGSGKANVIDEDEKRISVNLTPFMGNLMKGKADFRLTPETVVSVYVALEGYETQVARFIPLAPKVASDASNKDSDHHHHNESEGEHHHEHEEDDLEVE